MPGPAPASARDWLPWQPGDVVLTAAGDILTRAHGDSAAEGWPWSVGAQYVHLPGTGPSGGWSDDQATRPLTLLMRGGRPLGGAVINDQPVRGTVVREEVPPAQVPGARLARPARPTRPAPGPGAHGPRA
jgi:hypothetical protein